MSQAEHQDQTTMYPSTVYNYGSSNDGQDMPFGPDGNMGFIGSMPDYTQTQTQSRNQSGMSNSAPNMQTYATGVEHTLPTGTRQRNHNMMQQQQQQQGSGSYLGNGSSGTTVRANLAMGAIPNLQHLQNSVLQLQNMTRDLVSRVTILEQSVDTRAIGQLESRLKADWQPEIDSMKELKEQIKHILSQLLPGVPLP